jgi:protein-S-isoprenylcysteine O-methyltransferase Ste14
MKNPTVKLFMMTVISLIVISLALFLSAGTLAYWQAWTYLAVALLASVPYVKLMLKDPVLREGRTKLGPLAEKRPIQKIIVALSGLPGIALFIVPGLDYRFHWSSVPFGLTLAGDVLIFVSMWMVYRAVKENSFGWATIEVSENQKAISTGPYAIVRNPMYASALVYFIGMSLALGSYWSLLPAALTTFGLVWRLFDEEKFLSANLSGYKEYCAKVRWHLVPGIF